MNYILIGFKGTGKTTIAKIVSKKLKALFFDMDRIIEEEFSYNLNEKKSIKEIYQILQEREFRELESRSIKKLKNINNSIIASSGGFVLKNENILVLKKNCKFIYLNTSKKEIEKRIDIENAFLKTKENFEKEFLKRKSIYENIADMQIDINDENTPKDIANKVIDKIYGK
ncbi:MAG: Shikimate kinase [Candidatus Anoxychlamydiales bacterium]|nr:Shikimate kinase [Candidatus Anoxychlamydiales bacterium]